MTENYVPNALKHGAFSELLILPGEDPAAFEELKRSLFEEYNVSGCSEESTMKSIAKAMWQLQRLGVYEHCSTCAHAHAVPLPSLTEEI